MGLFNYIDNLYMMEIYERFLNKALMDSEEVFKYAKRVIYPEYKALSSGYEPVELSQELIEKFEGEKKQ